MGGDSCVEDDNHKDMNRIRMLLPGLLHCTVTLNVCIQICTGHVVM